MVDRAVKPAFEEIETRAGYPATLFTEMSLLMFALEF